MTRTVDEDAVVQEWQGLWRAPRSTDALPNLHALVARVVRKAVRDNDPGADDWEDLAQEILARIVVRARSEGASWEARSRETAVPAAALTRYLKLVAGSVLRTRARVRWRNDITLMPDDVLEGARAGEGEVAPEWEPADGLGDDAAQTSRVPLPLECVGPRFTGAERAYADPTWGVTTGAVELELADGSPRTRVERLSLRLLEPLIPRDAYHGKRCELLKLRLRLALVDPKHRGRVLRVWLGAPDANDARRMRNTLDRGFVRLYRTLSDGLRRGGGGPPDVQRRRETLVQTLFALQASRAPDHEGAPHG